MRTLLGMLVLAIALNTTPAHAQHKKPGGPRAIGVVTWNGDDPTPTPLTSVLTPVTILVEGRYYDAGLFQAQPEPLAVDAGVVYDVLQNGDPIGTFNVSAARQRDGVWYGMGLFDKKKAIPDKAAKSTAAKTQAAATEQEDERPHLRKGVPPPPAPKEQTDAVLNNIDLDPERPTLRRHRPEEKKSQSPTKEFVPPQMHMLVAVSDAGGPEPRPYTFRANPGELDKLRAAMEKFARAELGKQSKPAGAPASRSSAAKRVRGPSPALELRDAKLGVFDVNGNNAPIVVYSAVSIDEGIKKYVVVAAWEEIDESLRKVFAQITDDHHLDVYPRLEVIDAVDTSGNGRGELLFRAFGDQGSRFVLYHPAPDSLELLFDGAG